MSDSHALRTAAERHFWRAGWFCCENGRSGYMRCPVCAERVAVRWGEYSTPPPIQRRTLIEALAEHLHNHQ